MTLERSTLWKLALEHGSVANRLRARRAVGSQPPGNGPPRCPGPSLQNFRQRHLVSIAPQTLPHKTGQSVEQRHCEGAPFDDQRGTHFVLALDVSLIAQGKRPCINEETAIAIFGEACQAVDFGDRNSGSLHRLDERIGEPLGEHTSELQSHLNLLCRLLLVKK